MMLFPISVREPHRERSRIRLKVRGGNYPLSRTGDAEAATCRIEERQQPAILKAGADGKPLAAVIEGAKNCKSSSSSVDNEASDLSRSNNL